MESGIDVDGVHLPPGLVVHRKGVIGLASRRRGRVHEMGDVPNGFVSIRKESLASGSFGEVAYKGHRELRLARGLDRCRNALLADVGEHGAHALCHQRLRDRAADAIAGAGYKGRLACWIEGRAEGTHEGDRKSTRLNSSHD